MKNQNQDVTNTRIHFVGIKGVGMTALAILAKEMGYIVSGSDTTDNFVTDIELQKHQIAVSDFDINNLKNKPDIVVVSAAYDITNIEVKEAKKKRLEIKTYSELLAMLATSSKVIAVSGIHGKTTTTALISYLLSKAGFDPSFIIGSGQVASLGVTGHCGKGEYFVLEADEYKKSADDINPKFFDFSPEIEIITSIEMDHPDMFTSEERVYDAFYKFACKIPRSGLIVLCVDYPKSRKLLRSLVDRNFETYGFSLNSAYRIIDYKEDAETTSFSLSNNGKIIGPFILKIAGAGNVLNATAAIIAGLKLGISHKTIAKILINFSGVKRRFEKIGNVGNITIIDDYAHHPRSVAMTLQTLKRKYPQKKIWCIFQPHTYSRTKELLSEFSSAFNIADMVFVTDIYASAREKEATITGQDLAMAIRKNQRNVNYAPDQEAVLEKIKENAKTDIVIVTMGAGDIYKFGNNIYEQLKNEK